HEWLQEYNYSRPHEALNNLPPMTFKCENFVQ
ncbi:MAG: transposase, partial [Saprospiraceae bacterium]|nr:transposase [Saprospiraceae bacterium]